MEAAPKQRLFIAIPLPEALKHALHAHAPAISGMTSVPSENYHLTLRFLGTMGAKERDGLMAALSSITFPTFTLTLRGAGFFAPGILWAGVAPSEALLSLHAAVTAVVKSRGFGEDNRPYRPHVTLARGNRPDVKAMNVYLRQHEALAPGSFEVERFALYESHTLPEGASYTILRTFPA